MKVDDALKGVTHLFVDTAPVIYFVEKNPTYSALVKGIFDQVDAGVLMAVVSPVTLAECLVIPYRAGQKRLQQDFLDLLVRGRTQFLRLSIMWQDNGRLKCVRGITWTCWMLCRLLWHWVIVVRRC